VLLSKRDHESNKTKMGRGRKKVINQSTKTVREQRTIRVNREFESEGYSRVLTYDGVCEWMYAVGRGGRKVIKISDGGEEDRVL
jgi:hypothetical protein